MLEDQGISTTNNDQVSQVGCLAYACFAQSILLSIAGLLLALEWLFGFSSRGFWFIGVIFAIPIGGFQFIIGFLQYVTSRHLLLGLYFWCSLAYLLFFWIIPFSIDDHFLPIALMVLIPIVLSWLITYLQFYVTPRVKLPKKELYEDILDA